jgi:hypothetical protein
MNGICCPTVLEFGKCKIKAMAPPQGANVVTLSHGGMQKANVGQTPFSNGINSTSEYRALPKVTQPNTITIATKFQHEFWRGQEFKS